MSWQLACAGLAVATCLSACSAADPAATPTPTESGSPQHLPTGPVALRSEIHALSIDNDDVMTKRTGRKPMDEHAIAAVSDRLVALLRADLDARNLDDTDSELSRLAAQLVATDPAAGAMLASLASRDNPATDAAAAIRLGVDGVPRWASLDLDVTRRDGSHALLSMVLDLAGDGWRMLLVGDPESRP